MAKYCFEFLKDGKRYGLMVEALSLRHAFEKADALAGEGCIPTRVRD